MKIRSAKFITGVTLGSDIPDTTTRQVAFIGRSNVGKSSLINSLTGLKGLARPSATAGFTKQINFYLINKDFYLVDLPGYGYAQGSVQARQKLQQLIEWYLTYPGLTDHQKIILIVDAKVGLTDLDKQMIVLLEQLEKDFVIVANKIDKLKKNDLRKQLEAIEVITHPHTIIPYSTVDKIGIGALTKEIMQ